MFAIIIMLLILLEVYLAGSTILFLMKSRKDIIEINKEITFIKKEVINAFSDCRISIRMLNQEVKKIKIDQQTKQMVDLLNFIAGTSLFFGIKKKSICK